MTPGNQQRAVRLSFCILAGVEAGVLGGLAMLGWFLLSSALLHHSVWTIPNLLGSVLDDGEMLRSGFSGVTVSGLSLHFFVAGVVGILFGLVAAGIRSRRRVMFLGIITGLIWFYLSNAFIWRKLGALVWVYSSPRTLLVGHLVFGIVLGLYPIVLAAGTQPEPPPAD